MPAHCSTVLAVAAVVWDQTSHSEADLNFLYAVAAADKEWIDTLNSAKRDWDGDIKSFEIVKRLANKTREQALARALAELEANDDLEFAEAAE